MQINKLNDKPSFKKIFKRTDVELWILFFFYLEVVKNEFSLCCLLFCIFRTLPTSPIVWNPRLKKHRKEHGSVSVGSVDKEEEMTLQVIAI